MNHITLTTKAAVLTKIGQPLEIMNDIFVPAPGPHQLVVKILYAGVCHSQLMEVEGLRGEDKYLPHMLGHEGVGEVICVSESVSKVTPGDIVVLGWIKTGGGEGGGCQYKTKKGLVINAGSVAVFSEYAVVSENRVTPKPPHTPLPLSALYGCAIPTGLGMVLNNVPKDENISVAFIGLGGIGLSALLSNKICRFKKTIAIDINEKKLEIARKLGITHLVNAKESDPVSVVMQLTDGRGVDFCFESAGKAKTIEQAFAMVRRMGGRCIFASHPAASEKISLDPFELICGKKIEGSWGGSSLPDSDIPKFDKYYGEGFLPLDYLFDQTYSLEKINLALDDLKNQRVARALIKM